MNQQGQKMDILPLLIVLGILLVIVYYIFPPVRLMNVKMLCYLSAYESKIFFDEERYNFLIHRCHFLSEITPYRLSLIVKNPKAYDKLIEIYNEIDQHNKITDLYATILLAPVIMFFSFLLYKQSKFEETMVNKKINIIKFLSEKYNFKIKDLKNIEEVREQMEEYKTKINMPINLIARLYPKDSKERMYIYTKNKHMKFQPLDNIMYLLKEKITNNNK